MTYLMQDCIMLV